MRILAKATLALLLTAGMATTVHAADLVVLDPVIYDESQPMIWDGFYAGVTGGLARTSVGYVHVGAAIGYNAVVADGIVVGAELQTSAYFNENGYIGSDILAFARAGVLVTDDVLIYGLAGVGVLTPDTEVYTIGAGLEYAVADNVSLRLEAQGLGSFGGAPGLGKLSIGAMFHF